MGAELDSLDLDAAILRKSEAELRIFLNVLATKLEAALPGRVEVRRKRASLLSSKTYVAEIAINAGRALYAVRLQNGRVNTTRAKIVRDVIIGTSSLPPEDWLAEVRNELGTLAGTASEASDTVSRLL